MTNGFLTKREISNLSGETCAFITNSDCNIKCKHCFSANSEKKVISRNIIDETFKYINKNFCINILGGEPMLYPDICKYICDKARSIGASTSIVTNATWTENKDLVDYFIYKINPDMLILSTDKWHREFVPIEIIQKAINLFNNKMQIALELTIESTEETTSIDNTSFNIEKEIINSMNLENKDIFILMNPLRKEGRAIENNLGPKTSLCDKGICSINGFIVNYNGEFYIKCENSLSLKDSCKIWSKDITQDINIGQFKNFVKNKKSFFGKQFLDEKIFRIEEVFK